MIVQQYIETIIKGTEKLCFAVLLKESPLVTDEFHWQRVINVECVFMLRRHYVYKMARWIASYKYLKYLGYWDQNKMVHILQTIYSNAVPWQKMVEFQLKFH